MIPCGGGNDGCIDEDIASLFPLDLSGDVVALRACIDASSRAGVFTIAGVAYGYDRAVKANRQWEGLLNGRTFHMTDLNARKNDFEGITDDEKKRIMVGTVSIVRKYASYFIAVSCDLGIVADSLPVVASPDPDSRAMRDAFRSVYGYMCHFGMYALGLRAGGRGRQISYTFEYGDDGQRGLIKFLDFLQSKPGRGLFLDRYSLSRYTVTPKNNLEGIFHSSDLIAWEWSKHVERERDGHPMRRSLSALVGGRHKDRDEKHGLTLSDENQFFFRHFDSGFLDRSMGFFRETLAATTREDVNAALTRWEETR